MSNDDGQPHRSSPALRRRLTGLVLIAVAVVAVAQPAIELQRIASLCAVEPCFGSDGRKVLLSHGFDLSDTTVLRRAWLILIRDLPALGLVVLAHRLTDPADGPGPTTTRLVRAAPVALVALLALYPHVLLGETLDLTTRLTS